MWARLENDTVAEITAIDPAGRYHPSLQWVPCSPDTQPGWYFDGESTQPPPPEPLGDLATRKSVEIDTARNVAFGKGLPYDIAGTTDVVQTRPQDQINLLGLSGKAQRLIAAGDTTTLMPFRGLSNVTHQLTAREMDALALDALAYIESIYQRSWDRKDAIDASLKAGDREAIEAIEW